MRYGYTNIEAFSKFADISHKIFSKHQMGNPKLFFFIIEELTLLSEPESDYN